MAKQMAINMLIKKKHTRTIKFSHGTIKSHGKLRNVPWDFIVPWEIKKCPMGLYRPTGKFLVPWDINIPMGL